MPMLHLDTVFSPEIKAQVMQEIDNLQNNTELMKSMKNLLIQEPDGALKLNIEDYDTRNSTYQEIRKVVIKTLDNIKIDNETADKITQARWINASKKLALKRNGELRGRVMTGIKLWVPKKLKGFLNNTKAWFKTTWNDRHYALDQVSNSLVNIGKWLARQWYTIDQTSFTLTSSQIDQTFTQRQV